MSVCRSSSVRWRLGGEVAQLPAEDDIGLGGRRVQKHSVGQLGDPVAQHSHNRRDAATRGKEQHLGRGPLGQDEVAGGLVEHDERPRLSAVDEVVADQAVGDGFGGDGDQPVIAIGPRGQRVGPPVAHPVDVDADAHVLAGHMTAPASAGSDGHGCGVGRLGPHVDDAPAQVGSGAQRVEQVEVVCGQQRRGEELGHVPDSVAQPPAARVGKRCGHAAILPAPAARLLRVQRESSPRICSL